MPLVTLGLGSNIDSHSNIRSAVAELQARFGELKISPVYESKAVGFVGENFINLVVATEIDDSLQDLSAYLKALEDLHGRDRRAAKFSGRSLDIDILTYGDLQGRNFGVQLPRSEILEHAFVLRPLADLLPDLEHPTLGLSYAQLWESAEFSDQQLWPVAFNW